MNAQDGRTCKAAEERLTSSSHNYTGHPFAHNFIQRRGGFVQSNYYTGSPKGVPSLHARGSRTPVPKRDAAAPEPDHAQNAASTEHVNTLHIIDTSELCVAAGLSTCRALCPTTHSLSTITATPNHSIHIHTHLAGRTKTGHKNILPMQTHVNNDVCVAFCPLLRRCNPVARSHYL